MNEIVNKNKTILKIIIKDSTGTVITQSNVYADLIKRGFVSTNLQLEVGKLGTIEAYYSDFEENKSSELYQELVFNLLISIPFLILIAVFLYSSILIVSLISFNEPSICSIELSNFCLSK